MSQPRQPCTAHTRKNRPCRAHVVPGSDPPRCAAHGGTAPTTAPPAERNAAPCALLEAEAGPAGALSGRVALDAAVADLDRRIRALSEYIDRLDLDHEPEAYARLVRLHGQLCSRLGRLLRDRQALGGDQDDDLQAAIDEALELAAQVLGVDLG